MVSMRSTHKEYQAKGGETEAKKNTFRRGRRARFQIRETSGRHCPLRYGHRKTCPGQSTRAVTSVVPPLTGICQLTPIHDEVHSATYPRRCEGPLPGHLSYRTYQSGISHSEFIQCENVRAICTSVKLRGKRLQFATYGCEGGITELPQLQDFPLQVFILRPPS